MAFVFPVFCQSSIIIHVVSQIHFLVKIDNVFGVSYQQNPLNLVCIKDGLSPILKTVCCFWVLLFSNIKLIDSLLKPIAQKFHWDVIKPKYLGAVFDVYILRSAMKIGFHTFIVSSHFGSCLTILSLFFGVYFIAHIFLFIAFCKVSRKSVRSHKSWVKLKLENRKTELIRRTIKRKASKYSHRPAYLMKSDGTLNVFQQ